MSTDARQRLAALSAAERNALAERLARRRAPSASAGSIPRRTAGGDTCPLSFAQQRFWFLNQVAPLSAAYNVGEFNFLKGPLDVPALRRALGEIVRRHDVLRTTFATVDGRPAQRIGPALDVPLEVDDLSGHVDPRGEARRRVALVSAEPWDLEKGPLLRARLWRTAADEHALLILVHHIISDGWSKAVLVRELTELYAAYSRGGDGALPPPPIQYADFAAWQHEWVEGADAARQMAFWKQYMADPPVLQLPVGRGMAPGGSGRHHWAVIPAELSAAARSLAQREGVTLFMTLLAAFGVLLSRYSGQAEVVIGSPMANRTRPELENLIGCFMNPLPLRVDLRGNPPFREVLARVREGAVSAVANQEVPFDHLVRTLQPRRDPSTPPLFQAMLLLHNFWKSMALSAAEMNATAFRLDDGSLQALDGWSGPGDLVYPVALEIIDSGAAMLACFEYADAYGAVLARMPGHFHTLLQAAVADPDRRAAALPVLTSPERRQLLAEWNHERRAHPPQCAHRLFEAEVERDPSAPAVVMGRDRWSYGELNARANRLARRLRGMGIGPENRVGLLLDRSPRMYQGVLGVMKSGGAYVPLDPAYPQERLAFILRNAGIRALVTERSLADVAGALVAGAPVPVVWLDDDAACTGGDAANVDGGATPDHLAYVIYTSGSTGNPKGTMITHRSLSNAYRGWEEVYDLRRGPRCHLQMASLSFDVFSGDLVRALCSGGRLVICPHDALFAPERLHALMREEQVDSAEFVPVVLRDVMAYLERTGQDLSFLRLLVAGSDTWYANEYMKVRGFCSPQTRVINSYGVTEATIDSTWFESEDLRGDGPVPLGRAFPNTELYVLDAEGQPAPIGVAAELFIGGDGLARGYLDAPGLTAERFVPHPFSAVPGARLYRTGDMARYLPDGAIEFLGRLDDQVKLRGFRIEPGEIEAVLSGHEAVAEAVAAIREDRPGDRRLVAYVLARDGAEPNATELRRLAKERLPDYMVPSAIVTLGAWPRTPNGKIDRRALPAPDGARQLDEAAFVPPRSDAERRLAAIWGEVLGLEKVGVEDNFFDLGGHSLLVVRLHARVRETFAREVSVVDLFRFPTVAALARQLAAPDAADGFVDEIRDRTRRQREAIARRRPVPGGKRVATL